MFSANTILEYRYGELDEESKNQISKYYQGEYKEKMIIIKVPYNVSRNLATKRHFIMEKLKEFLVKINVDTGYSVAIFDKWHMYLENSATSSEKSFFLTKEELVWVIINELLNFKIKNEDFEDEDDSLIEVVQKRCCQLIGDSIFYDFEIVNKVISMFKEYTKKKLKNFIEENFDQLCEIIFPKLDVKSINEIDSLCVKIIVRIILKNRTLINDVKKGVGIQ